MPYDIAKILDEGLGLMRGEVVDSHLCEVLDDVYEETAHLGFWDEEDVAWRLEHFAKMRYKTWPVTALP